MSDEANLNVEEMMQDSTEIVGLSLFEEMVVKQTLEIAELHAQNARLLAMIDEANEMLTKSTHVVVAARAFVDVLSLQFKKTGEGAFKATHAVEDNDPIVETLNFRFSDLAAALNGVGRPVAPKLSQGTVH